MIGFRVFRAFISSAILSNNTLLYLAILPAPLTRQRDTINGIETRAREYLIEVTNTSRVDIAISIK